MFHRSVVPAHDRTGVACTEGDMGTGGHPVAAGLATDGVQAEVIVVAAPEQDVGVTLELAFGQHHESDFRQRGFVHQPARGQVADSDADVVDDVAHRPFDSLSAGVVRIDETYRHPPSASSSVRPPGAPRVARVDAQSASATG